MAITTPKSGINRAVVYSEPPTLKTEIKELPIPGPGPGEVLVRLYAIDEPCFQIIHAQHNI